MVSPARRGFRRAYTEGRGRGQAGSCGGGIRGFEVRAPRSGRGYGLTEIMARYIDEILQPGERVLYSTNAHWIFYFPAIVAWIVALAFLVLARQSTVDGLMMLSLAAAGVAALAGLFWTIKGWFHRF